jgi:gluconate 5-dehydrogenase
MSEHTSVMELFDLTGQVAIVTGAPGQLGEAMSEVLAELGANIVVVSRTKSECDVLAERLSNEYQKSISAPTDVTKPDEVSALIEYVQEEFGQIDILVNNAYSGETIPFEEMSIDEFQNGLDSALTSAFLMTREALPLLKSGGAIINISSIYGIVAPDHSIYGDTDMNNPVHYGVAKSGIIQFSRWIATRYADEGIRANTLTPGGIYNPELKSKTDYEETFVPNYEESTPMGRMGTPEDLKGAIAYLASDASKWVTGQNIIVDGGWTTW